MDDIMKDERFSHISKDPRFRSIPKKERKVVVDKRFQSMFHDKHFKLKYAMDKRGRKVVHSTTEDLKKFYDLESTDEDSEQDSSTEQNEEIKTSKERLKKVENINAENPELQRKYDPKKYSLQEEDVTTTEQSENVIDLARGEGNVETSSSDDDDDDVDGGNEDDSDSELDHKWGELDAETLCVDEATRRLAVCNMNWDRIKADDLFILFNSFKPLEGTIASVKIYPSEYGKERMKIEEMKGPIELVENSHSARERSEDNPEGSKFHMEKLRQYQLNRLKYYYAVIDCDSPETANKIYEELNGMEYESSATQLDLRFIPDDIVFNEEATSETFKMPDMTKYETNIFTTTALQQAKVDLTWDETDPDRVKTIQKAFKDSEEVDLKAYLASSSEEEEELPLKDDTPEEKSVAKNQIEKYKELLASIEEEERKKKERDIDMEITWEPGLKEKTAKLVQMKQAKEMTPWEEYLQKKKEKRKQKKKDQRGNVQPDSGNESAGENAFSDDEIPSDIDLNDPYFKEELSGTMGKQSKKKLRAKATGVENPLKESDQAELELLLMDEHEDKNHFNLRDLVEDAKKSKKKKKKHLQQQLKNKKDQPDDFQIDTTDPRFAALYSSPLFNIDPSDPQFKRTKGIEAIIKEKQKKRHLQSDPSSFAECKMSKTEKNSEGINNPALSMLIKSIKSKTEKIRRKY